MERFTTNYIKFYDSVKEITPELFEENKPTLPESQNEKVNFFVKNWYPHMKEVSNGNLKYFEDNKINPSVFNNLNFLDIVAKLSDKNKNVIWEYLHTLYALSISSEQVKENFCSNEVNEIEGFDGEMLTQVKEAINNFPEFVSNMVSWKRERHEIEEKGEKKEKNTFDEKAFEGSSIARIAKEISDEINPEEVLNLGDDMKNMDNPMKLFQSLLSGDGNNENGIGKLMTTVVDKLKNKMDSGEVSQEDLLNESMSMLQSMGGGSPGNSRGGGPDMAGMMQMMQGLSGMGDLFSGMGNQGGGGQRRRSRKVRRKMDKKMRKKNKKKE